MEARLAKTDAVIRLVRIAQQPATMKTGVGRLASVRVDENRVSKVGQGHCESGEGGRGGGN